MATLCKHFKISARVCAGLFALLCCAASYGVRADDLYFSPKKQKEIDRQNAVLKAYHDSIRAAQRPAVNDYTATWSNFDSVDHRGYRGIYELSQNQEQPNEDEPERESYADRLRFEDQTYVVLVREPYYPWWGWGYPSWGVSWGSWGWNAGWNYPYYGWNYPYYSWGYPYYGWNYYGYGYGYGWGWSYPYYGYGYSYNHRPVRYANSQHRGSNVSGTGGNSGYTNRPSQRTSSSLSLPSSGYTQRTQGEYTRPSQGAAGSSSGSNTVYSSSGRSYQSIQQERSQQNSNSSWGSRNTSSQSYSSGSSSSSSSSSSSYSGGSRSSGGSSSGSSGGSRRGGSGR